jgi:hypothetical protein
MHGNANRQGCRHAPCPHLSGVRSTASGGRWSWTTRYSHAKTTKHDGSNGREDDASDVRQQPFSNEQHHAPEGDPYEQREHRCLKQDKSLTAMKSLG